MKLSIRLRHCRLSNAAYDQITRRVAFALGRFAHVIRSVDVLIIDVNGPKGGVDKRARLRIRGRGFRPIVIEQASSDALAAVALAVHRAAHSVQRELGRRRGFGRRLVPA